MRQNFLDYAKFYNLLYKDKDYEGECKFIHELILKYHPNAKTILDVGCGTGRHASILKRDYGYEVTGVDLSHDMISIAKTNYPDLAFTRGSANTFRLEQKFDVITSLFHVLSYQNTNEEVKSYFANIKSHLKLNGIFIFDYWYGPAVLNLKPESRVKEMQDDHYKITRFASTSMDYNNNIANVHYKMLCEDRDGKIMHLNETHPMRYFFLPEIKMFLDSSRLTTLHHSEWLSLNKSPSGNSWAIFNVVKAG